jgi:hypothetical protein
MPAFFKKLRLDGSCQQTSNDIHECVRPIGLENTTLTGQRRWGPGRPITGQQFAVALAHRLSAAFRLKGRSVIGILTRIELLPKIVSPIDLSQIINE